MSDEKQYKIKELPPRDEEDFKKKFMESLETGLEVTKHQYELLSHSDKVITDDPEELEDWIKIKINRYHEKANAIIQDYVQRAVEAAQKS